jgi:hypothetical protein
MAKLVSPKKLVGFTIFESLICLFVFQLIYLIVWPNFQSFIQYQQCKTAVLRLQHLIMDAQAKAIVLNQPVFIEKLVNQKWFIIMPDERQSIEFQGTDFQMSWKGFSGTLKLTFYPELLANHVNGYFEIFCARKYSFRLWLNRLGHTRLEM